MCRARGRDNMKFLLRGGPSDGRIVETGKPRRLFVPDPMPPEIEKHQFTLDTLVVWHQPLSMYEPVGVEGEMSYIGRSC
jgi:hypothetical protein